MLQSINNKIINTVEAKLLDTKAVEINNIPQIILMEEAAEKIITNLKNDFNDLQDENIAIIAGWGNNGGDVLSVARRLFIEGINFDIYHFEDKKSSILNETHKKILKSFRIKLINIIKLKKNINKYTLILDGIFGIGYKYREDKNIENLFISLNESNAKIVAIDVPSGLNFMYDD